MQSELASCHLQVPRLRITYSGARRVDEQRDAGGRRKKLVQEFDPLRSHLCIQRHYAREVAAWSAQAGDKSKFDRIARYVEDDRNRRGRRLGRSVAGVLPPVKITVTSRRTRSAASAGNRSYCPSAQRYSIATLRPST